MLLEKYLKKHKYVQSVSNQGKQRTGRNQDHEVESLQINVLKSV